MLFLDGQQAARCVQVTDSRFFDELDKSQAASVGDGRFDRIHFDEAVIHFHAAQGGQQMLYCEDLGFPVFQRRRPHCIGYIREMGLYRRSAGQIRPDKDDACISRSRAQYHMNFIRSMQADAVI